MTGDCPENESKQTKPCCCSAAEEQPKLAPKKQPGHDEPWITGTIHSAAGDIPIVATTLDLADTLGSWKARWGIGRMR